MERWSAAAGRQCMAGVAPGQGRAPDHRASVAPGWGRAPGEAAGRCGVGADALTTVSNKLPCQNQDKVLSLQVSKPCKKKHALN